MAPRRALNPISDKSDIPDNLVSPHRNQTADITPASIQKKADVSSNVFCKVVDTVEALLCEAAARPDDRFWCDRLPRDARGKCKDCTDGGLPCLMPRRTTVKGRKRSQKCYACFAERKRCSNYSAHSCYALA